MSDRPADAILELPIKNIVNTLLVVDRKTDEQTFLLSVQDKDGTIHLVAIKQNK